MTGPNCQPQAGPGTFHRRFVLRCFRGVAIGLVAVSLAGGCTRSSRIAVDTGPFEAAIGRYLKGRSLGMRVHEFKELEVTDTRAEGLVSLEHAEGGTGLKVRWRFWFLRQNGEWRVSRHES